MSNAKGKSRKALVIGVIAAVVVLAALLAVLLTQCNGAGTGETTPSTTEGEKVVETYDLYWNIDRALYDGKSEAGMSSRTPESDGYFHVRFFKDGEIVTLKVAERKTINAMEVQDLMGLEIDENGIVTGIILLDELPCEPVAWQFYVQSAGGKLIKANSSASLNGMEVLLETTDKTGIWDMTGLSGDVGCDATPIPYDRILGVANGAGEVTHVFIYSRENYMRTHEAECEHCGKVVEWSEWVKENAAPSITGHYQLMNDIQIPSNGAQISMAEDQKICLDLNGKRIDGKANSRVYSLHNPGTELAIMDTSEEKTGTIAAHGKGDQGMCVWLRYGVVYLYDGILDASDATSIKNGTTVALQANTYMYMYGGELIGGTSAYLRNENGTYTNGLGGTLAIGSKGKFVMNDGVIRDGYAQAVITARDKNGQPTTYARGIGGNIFMSSGSVFEMNGGVIKNGKAGNIGGNVYLDGTAEFTMNGGKIQGGTITGKGRNGGSVYITTKATFTLKSGSITGGSSRNCGGNVYTNGKFIMTGGYVGGGRIINWSTGKLAPESASRNVFIVNGDFRMYGGSIDGGVQAIDTDAKKTVTRVGLTTYATIASETAPNLTISSGGSGVVVNVGDLRDSAKIGVTTSVGLFSQITSEKNLDNFYSEVEGADVVYFQERLGLGRVSCLCGGEGEGHLAGCDGELLFWAPWTSTNSLPTTTGNYYLLKDVKCGQQNVAGDAVINLDLNGHRVDGNSNGRIYSMHNRVETDNGDGTKTYSYPAHLTITDTSEGRKGVMASHGTANHQGSIAWLRYGDVTLLAGTFDASDYKAFSNWGAGNDNVFGTSDDTTTNIAGAAFSVPGGRTLTMYGGTVIGGETIAQEQTKTNTTPVPEGAPEGTEPTVEEVKKTVSAGGGGSIEVTGNFYMYGGTIRDGVSGNAGGNIRIISGGKMYMYGGEVLNGTSTVGNGGNIQVSGTLELHGGTISGGWSKNVAGNIHVSGKLVMDGGYITGGKVGASASTTADDANIYSVNGTMHISGGKVDGHVRVINYQVTDPSKGAKTYFSGNPVISGGKVNLVVTYVGGAGYLSEMPTTYISGPMTEGAKIEVSLAKQDIDFASGDGYTLTAQDGLAFETLNGGIKATVDTENNTMFFGRYNCFCGKEAHTFGCQQVGGGKDIKWYAWDYAGSLPTTGNYFLTCDITGSGSTTVQTGTTLNLDLNGKTVNWKYRAYRIYDANAVANATLTITNTAATEGTIRSVEYSGTDQGFAVWVAGSENGVFNLLDGVVLDGSKYTIKNIPSEGSGAGSTAEKNGGVVAIQTGGVFNMYGGTIIGANAIRSEEITLSNGTKYSSYAPNGAAVAVTGGNANMYGGEITGGRTANQGGNLLISSGKFTMTGGVISDGYATSNGGNVFVHRSGELLMSGDARIEGGESGNHSGNINVDGKMSMTDNATVTGGKAQGAAGNININFITSGGVTYYGQLTMSGKASVTDGEAATEAGNIRILKGTSMTMTDETLVSGGVAKNGKGGNINVADSGSTLTLSGKATVKDGKATTNGGNINLSGTSTMTASGDVVISGGEVCGAKGVESTGGNLAVVGDGSKATLSGNVKVLDGSSWHTGGNVRISAGATLTVKDNVLIDGGKSSNSKSDTTKSLNDTNANANIFCVNGNMELFGGKITGNINMITTNSSGSVKLSGAPVITKGGSGYGLYSSVSGSANPVQLQVVGAMTGEPGSVVIGISTGTGIIGSGSGYELTDTDAAAFASDQKGKAAGCVIIRDGNNLVVGKGECLCGQETHTKACLELWNGEERTWIGWTSTTSLPTTTGNYYLTGNVDFDWQQKIAKDANIVLDLNGYTITNDNGQRMYSTWETGSSLTITDKSEAQTGKLVGSGDAVDQALVWVRYGTFNLVAGTIDASGYNLRNVWDTAKAAISEKNGGTVWVGSGTTFNMYGGELIGANCVRSKVTVDGAEKDIYAPNGGTLSSSGTVNMYDGIIRDGKANEGGNVYISSGKFNMYGGQILDGTASNRGGNIRIGANGTMTLKEGVIVSGGEATGGTGGNILVQGTLNIDGATIDGGVSKGNGGNIIINSGATVNLTSGTVSNGWSKNVSGNIHIDGGKLNMSGGTVKGGKTGTAPVTTATHADVQSVCGTWNFTGGTVEGNAMIFNYNVEVATVPTTTLGGNATIKGSLYLNYTDGKTAPVITVNDDFAGSIKLGAKADGIFTTNAVTAQQAKLFTSSDSEKGIYQLTTAMGAAAADEGKLYIGKVHCECGQLSGSHEAFCDGKDYIWTPWTGSAMPSDSGHYYLTGNLTVSSSVTLNKVCDIVIDLNGYNIASSAGRMYSMRNTADHAQVKSVLLTNTYNGQRSGKQATISVSGAGDQGRIVWLNGEAKTVVAYNLDIDMSKATVNNASSKNGLAFATTAENGTSNDKADGTAVWATNYVKLYDVKLTGGTAHASGNLIAGAGATNILLENCYLTSGNASHLNGSTETTTGGLGGAIYMSNNGSLTLTDTVVTGCTATVNGGGVYMGGTSKLTINGDTKIYGNTVDGAENNLYIEAGATLLIGTLGSNAQVGLGGVVGDTLSTDATYSDMSAFKPDSEDLKLAHMNGALSLQDASAHIHCVCGGTLTNGQQLPDGTYHYCNDIVYTAMNVTTGNIGGDKNWYLADDLTLTGQLTTQNYVLNLCLNGHSITTSANARMIRTYCSTASTTDDNRIVLTSCQADKVVDGKVTNNRIYQKNVTLSDNGDGGIFWLTSSGTLEMYAGCLDASMYTLKPNSADTAKHGTAVKVEGGSVFKLYGGTIYGGKTQKGTSNNSEGACIFSQGTIIMNGGKIVGGETVGSGGSLFLFTDSVTKIYGGTITGGKAANNGGNIFFQGKELLIAGGTIEKGTAGNRGGNVYFAAAGGTISGGTISGGEAKDGGNVANNTNIAFAMTGGTTTAGKASSAGGNIWLMGPMTMTGGTVSGGIKGTSDADNTGANVAMNGTGSLDISGGTIKGRVAALVAGSKLKVSGSAKIYDTDTTNNLYVNNFVITIGELNSDAKIGLLILKDDQVGSTVATVANGVTIDPAQFPVHDLELTNSSSRSFAAQQDGTALKIVEKTN